MVELQPRGHAGQHLRRATRRMPPLLLNAMPVVDHAVRWKSARTVCSSQRTPCLFGRHWTRRCARTAPASIPVHPPSCQRWAKGLWFSVSLDIRYHAATLQKFLAGLVSESGYRSLEDEHQDSRVAVPRHVHATAVHVCQQHLRIFSLRLSSTPAHILPGQKIKDAQT